MIDRSSRTPELQRAPRTGFRANEVGRRPAAAQAVPKRVGLIVGRRQRVGSVCWRSAVARLRLPRAREIGAIKVNAPLNAVV